MTARSDTARPHSQLAYVKTVLRDVGIMLHIPGCMALASLPVCLLSGEAYAAADFLLTALASLAVGQLGYWLGHHGPQAQTRQSLVTAALAWGLVPFLGALPFLMVAHHLGNDALPTITYFQNPLNALFEGMSGFTSAGLTMTVREDVLPRSLQWWRSLMQWVGGVGIIVLMIAVLEPAAGAYQLYSAEGRQKRIAPTLNRTVRRIWWIYGVYTLGAIILFRVAGMPWWEALNHAMTAISTGGFSVTEAAWRAMLRRSSWRWQG